MDGRKFKDQFLWDKNEPYLNLETFTDILLEEHNLSVNYEHEILNQLKR